MADAKTEENEFGQELADAFAADEAAENPVAPVEEPKKEEEVTPSAPTDAPKVEEPKKDDPAQPAEDPNKKEDPVTPPADPAKKPEDGDASATDPKATPPPPTEEPVTSKPLTQEDLAAAINKVQNDARDSTQAIQIATDQVMEAYYPEGLSNVLVDQNSGKQLKTPQDVVDASGGDMDIEQATQWLMNEQYKLDNSIKEIRQNAEKIAETTLAFKRDAIAAVQKYEPLFTAYPHLQAKAYDLMMKQVKDDKDRNVILSAPDVMDLYDTYLEPYQMAYEQATKQSATNPVVPPTNPIAPPVATPGLDDRMDEGGDGGTSPVDDPNDFAQQVTKELSKGM